MNLYLFDIDGTLVNINNFHIQAYRDAYKKICNTDVQDELILSHFGKAEHEQQEAIFSEMNLLKEKIPELIQTYIENVKALVTRDKIVPLPGVIELLTELKKDKNIILGIVTGNTEAMMELILKSAGLLHFFTVFGFDDSKVKSRVDIVKNALRKAGSSITRIIVIGDTVTDIEAGKAVGATTVGVATGTNTYERLNAAKPDIVIASLEDYNELLNNILLLIDKKAI